MEDSLPACLPQGYPSRRRSRRAIGLGHNTNCSQAVCRQLVSKVAGGESREGMVTRRKKLLGKVWKAFGGVSMKLVNPHGSPVYKGDIRTGGSCTSDLSDGKYGRLWRLPPHRPTYRTKRQSAGMQCKLRQAVVIYPQGMVDACYATSWQW